MPSIEIVYDLYGAKALVTLSLSLSHFLSLSLTGEARACSKRSSFSQSVSQSACVIIILITDVKSCRTFGQGRKEAAGEGCGRGGQQHWPLLLSWKIEETWPEWLQVFCPKNIWSTDIWSKLWLFHLANCQLVNSRHKVYFPNMFARCWSTKCFLIKMHGTLKRDLLTNQFFYQMMELMESFFYQNSWNLVWFYVI